MKEKIIKIASQLFLNLGFKSVAMDDLASKMGISKKNIYQYFKNKTKLVEATTDYVFNKACQDINSIRAENKNPIDELFSINKYAKQFLKNEGSSPEYQLQKYCPNVYKKLKQDNFLIMTECIGDNINKA